MPEEHLQRFADDVWVRLGYNPEDKTTWEKEKVSCFGFDADELLFFKQTFNVDWDWERSLTTIFSTEWFRFGIDPHASA